MFLSQVQYGAYVNIGGLGSVIKLMFAGILFFLLVKFSFGRKLLTKVSVQNTKELSVWRCFFLPSLLLVFFVCSPSLPSRYVVPSLFLCWILHKGWTNPETGN